MDTATSKTTVNLVIIFLGVFALIALAGTVYLIDQAKASGAEVALVSSPMVFALGAIAGILSSTRSPIAAQVPQPAAILAEAGLAAPAPMAPTTYAPTLSEPLPLADHAQA